MAILAVELERGGEATVFLLGVRERLRKPDLIQNPFKGAVKLFPRKDALLAVVSLTPIYPPIFWPGIIALGVSLVWARWWLILPGALLSAFGVLWTPAFYYLFLRAGLRRAGYHGRVRWLRLSTAWGWLLGTD